MLGALAFFAAAHSAFVAAAPPCQVDPTVVKSAHPAVPPEYMKHIAGFHTAVVAVTLDAEGHVTAASIYTSSGSDVLDSAAVDAAKRSTYAPGETDCKPAGGTFAVQFSFEPADGAGTPQCPRAATVVSPKLIAVPVRRQAGKSQTSADDGVMCKAVTGTYLFIVTFYPRG